MDPDRLELIQHLFALATEIAEDAHAVAVSGQGVEVSPGAIIEAAKDLCDQADRLRTIGATILIAAGSENPFIKTDSSP